MKHAVLFKKILAFVLAALIGLSALSGLIMAFAEEKKYDYEYELETTEDSKVYLEQDDDFALVVPAAGLIDLMLEFEDVAAFSVEPVTGNSYWVGFDTNYSTIIQELGNTHGVSFDVLNFTFSPVFENEGTLTFATKNPYLYRLEGRTLTPLVTDYTDGTHSFKTNTLGCFVAANSEIAL